MKKYRTKSLLLAAVLGAELLLSPCVGMAMPEKSGACTAGVAVEQLVSDVMTITGTALNNVINWRSFDIASHEKVKFNDKNYLNLIHDNKASEILGTLTGGGNIYLINPNGVIFGDNSSVNVGNLYVSTNALTAKAISDFEKNGTNPLAGSVANGGDIMNLGKIQADSVYFEGNVVMLKNADDITKDGNARNNNVTINARDAIEIGNVTIDVKDNITNITSTQENNVIGWPTFNVDVDDIVQFDKHNYLNLVYKNSPSYILGKITAGGNVYIINPNGIIFGYGSTTNVGNLYLSTQSISNKEWSTYIGDNGALKPSSSDIIKNLTGDVSVLGNVTAKGSMYIVGNTITLADTGEMMIGNEIIAKGNAGRWAFVDDGKNSANRNSVNDNQYKAKIISKKVTYTSRDGEEILATIETSTGEAVTKYWLVRDIYELQNMKNNLTANYMLAGDIDATTTEGWNDGAGFQPVGTTTAFEEYNSAYTGKFDGLNHKINGLFINRPTEDYVGLFGFTHNAEVKNLSISGQIIGNLYVGSIAGYNDAGTIKNVTNEGDVSGMYVGGLVGYNSDGTVIGVNKGDVLGEALLYEYELDDSGQVMFLGEVSPADYVGGLVGYSGRRSSVPGPELGVVTGTNFGKVEGNNFVGGLVGANDATVTGQNMGTVIGYGALSGDLVGENFGTVNGTDANFKNIFEDIDIILNGVEAIGLERVLKVFQEAKDYQRLNRDAILLQPGLNINLAGQVIAGNTLPLVQFEKDEE